MTQVRMQTSYMGLKLSSPLVASASPLARSVENLRALQEQGAGAVVLFSIFEEQVRHELEEMEYLAHYGDESFPEALNYFPKVGTYRSGTDEYLDHIREAKQALEIPVIASLNGTSVGSWVEFARRMQSAGADGLELNLYHLPTNPEQSSAQVEERYLEVVRAVKAAVSLPVAVKLAPFFSSMAYMAVQFEKAGADALVLFNRFYQPDLDIETPAVVSTLTLSTPRETRLPLRWIALLHGRLRAALAGSTGVESATEVVKYLMAGADVVMTTSALLKHGIPHLATLQADTAAWMEKHGYDSVDQLRGVLSQKEVSHPEAFERAQYIKVLENYRSAAGA